MLTATEAAEIAIEAGLGIGDAVSLRLLADDRETARAIAARFAASANDNQSGTLRRSA